MEREKNERELEKVEKAKLSYEENRNRQQEYDIKNLH